jgi:glyoxylase I family protein
MTILGIHHLAIKVRDLAASEHFYVGVLGLKVVRRWPAPGGGDRSVWLHAGGDGAGAEAEAFLALERVAHEVPVDTQVAGGDEAPTRPERAGHHLLALRIRHDERSIWEARLVAGGATISHRTPHTIYFADPEGNRLGLSHHPDLADLAESV